MGRGGGREKVITHRVETKPIRWPNRLLKSFIRLSPQKPIMKFGTWKP